jgi:hypothetical protein
MLCRGRRTKDIVFATWFEGVGFYGVATGEPLNGVATTCGAVYLVCDGCLKIADSFEEFVDLYIADDSRLHLDGARAVNGRPLLP